MGNSLKVQEKNTLCRDKDMVCPKTHPVLLVGEGDVVVFRAAVELRVWLDSQRSVTVVGSQAICHTSACSWQRAQFLLLPAKTF